VQVGDHVIMSYASCGSCPHCNVGKPAYCYKHGDVNFGGTHLDGSLTHSLPSEPSTKLYGACARASLCECVFVHICLCECAYVPLCRGLLFRPAL